jgi:two-component system CheB/CheR fusion protein
MLGTAEGVAGQHELFDPVSKKWRIFRRRAGRPSQLRVPKSRRLEVGTRRAEPREPDEADVARRLLAETSSPPAVVVDSSYTVLYLHGEVSPYLSLPIGTPRMVLADLLRPSLRSRVRAGLFRAFRDGEPVELRTPRSELEEGEAPVRVRVVPHEVTELGPLALVIFEPAPEDGVETHAPVPADELAVVEELERELESTREELRSTVEELEASNEELKASNEEVLSINEELQSANEELETSSEELRSLNQELSTVNAQLKMKLLELGEAHDDLSNLLSSTRLGVVFLDPALAVRRFTAAVVRLLPLSRSDLGRPIAEVPRRFDDPHHEEDAARVLTDLSPIER